MYFFGSQFQPQASNQQPVTTSTGGQGTDYQAAPGFTSTQSQSQPTNTNPQDQPLGLFGQGINNIINSPFGKFTGNVLGGINNFFSPQKLVNQNAPDTATLIGDALSIPQRALFTLGTKVASGPTDKVPNYFDFTQDPGSQLSNFLTGGKPADIQTGTKTLGTIPLSMALDLVDPMLLLGGGEGDAAKIALSSGKEAALSKEGLGALKDLAQTTHGTSDLVQLGLRDGGKPLEDLKNVIAQKAETTNPEFLSKGGLKFAGQTVIPGDTLAAGASKLTDNSLVNKVKDSGLFQKAENGLQTLFNVRKTPVGMISEQDYNLLKPLFNLKTVAAQKTYDFIKGIFGGLNPDQLNEFRMLAKNGIGDLNRTDLVGKSITDLQKLAPDVSPEALSAYYRYINEGLPKLEKLAKDNFNLTDEHAANNYLHEYKSNRLTNRQIFGR